MKFVKSKKIHQHIIIIVILILLLISLGFGVWWYISKCNKVSNIAKIKTATSSKSTSKKLQTQNEIIHMAAMGDMLAHDTIIANAKTDSGYDFSKYFVNIRSSYRDADVIFCNQEGLSSGEQYGISGYPSFNAPIQFSSGLQSGAGCNLINLANNHMGDKGVAATNATIDIWNGLKPLAFSGANKSADDQNKVSYATVNGIKIGFVSFADFNNNTATPDYSVNIYHDETLVRRLVTDARANADVVIVSMHWGVEDSSTVSADQENEVNLLSSLGVDVIIGTGPHVLQKVETVDRTDGGKTIVWYSLGNMLSSQLNIKELIGGIAQFNIIKDAKNKITINNLSFTPTYMHYEWTASEAANDDLLTRKNAMIYLLSAAAEPLSRSLFNTTVAEQKQYVIDTLGKEVIVK
jgi:poly-gamma-glutamate capsule biosynthesis protein CapA/YwtB (metallophosphatase superfamily)